MLLAKRPGGLKITVSSSFTEEEPSGPASWDTAARRCVRVPPRAQSSRPSAHRWAQTIAQSSARFGGGLGEVRGHFPSFSLHEMIGELHTHLSMR